MKRLAVDLSFFVRDSRGMGRVVRNILQELLRAGDCDEFVFLLKRREDMAPLNQWVQERAPGIRHRLLLRSEAAKLSTDLCWYPWNRVDFLPGSGRRVVTINDVNPFVFPLPGFWRKWTQYNDERRFHKATALADRIVTISQFSRQEIVRHLGVATEKISVMPLGVDAQWFVSGAARQQTLRDVDRPPRLLYVGSDDERKNLPGLLQAMQVLHQSLGCAASLVCCGVGPEAEAKYRPRLSESGLGGAVRFAGFVSDAELKEHYRDADLFVFPSLYEGFGLPLLESMAAGLPVVSSQAASLPEVGGDAAAYCDPQQPFSIASAIRDTWANPDLCERLRERGLARAAEFTWRRAAQALQEIFQQTLTRD